MTRTRNAPSRHQRRKKVLKQARGYRGGRSKLYRSARETTLRAGAASYRGRKLKKRDFRSLWITRISAAAKRDGLSYSRLMGLLSRDKVGLNRKVLAEMAVHHPDVFSRLVQQFKK